MVVLHVHPGLACHICMKFIITTIVIYGVIHNGPNTDVMYSTIYPVFIDLR